MELLVPLPVRSKLCNQSSAEIAGLNSAKGMDVCCECCVLSVRGLCGELITHQEESADCDASFTVI